MDLLWHLLLALAAVVVAGRALGELFRLAGQPPVIGEVVAGILLGPSFLGHVSPAGYAFLLPESVAPSLGLVSQLGVVLYMFLIGVELDTDGLKGQLRSTIAIGLTSIVVPFALGTWLARGLYESFAPAGVPFSSFALFLGIAMSITAFPVLARILTDRGLTRTSLGRLALSCAAVNDVVAWCLLALVVGIVNSREGTALLTSLMTLMFIPAMFLLVRPIVVKWVQRRERHEPDRNVVALALVGMLLSALAAEAIGVHAIFGAFLFGAVIPHNSRLAPVLEQRIDYLVTILLLPAFFAFTGMRTEIRLVSGRSEWLVVALIVAVATVGKFGGASLGARLAGHEWRRAAALGILMNARGLMELIVLNVGLELGVISPTLFTMMVLMALVTTLATTPLLRLFVRGHTAQGTAVSI